MPASLRWGRALVLLASALALDAPRPRNVCSRRALGGATAFGVPGAALALGLPSVGLPSLPKVGIPGMDGQVGSVEVGGVELNPFRELEGRPTESVPDDAEPIEVDALVALARRDKVKSVAFLTANGDRAVATLTSGATRSIKVEDDRSGSLRLTGKLRDYGVPYTYPFDLSKFTDASKRTSMRAKNQNVLDAEARSADQTEKLRAMEARIADEAAATAGVAAEAGAAAAPPPAPVLE